MDLRDLIGRLADAGHLLRVERPVSPRFQLANVAHALDGRPVLFTSIAGFPAWRVLTGSCSDRRYLALALGITPGELLSTLARAVTGPATPPVLPAGPCQEVVLDMVDLGRLPILHHLAADAGPYVTAGVVIIDDPEHGRPTSL